MGQRARPSHAFLPSSLFLPMTAAQEGKKMPARLTKSCILIIVVASVERFAYKGVASNMVMYLTEVVHLSTSAAAKTVNYWCGVTSMLPLLGAFLADSMWDRRSTIIFSSLLYVTGLVVLTAWACFQRHMPSSSLFFPLYLISIGQGGYNPSLQAFGADHIEAEQKSVFFQWWYFGICSGSLLGNSIMSYVQDNYGWVIGFAVPTVVMAITSVSFAAGALFCVGKGGGAAEGFIEWINRCLVWRLAPRRSRLPGRDDDDGAELELQGKPLKEDELQSSKPTATREFTTGDVEMPGKSPAPEKNTGADEPLQPRTWKVILRLLPTWATLLMFAVIFQLPSTFFTLQGAAMERSIGGNLSIPPATLQSSITVSIILIMPLYNKLITPFFRAITGREEGINVTERIGVGMLMSVAAMAVAALVEHRRAAFTRYGGARLSIFWLLPQYIMLGLADVFTVVGMQEFFYGSVPSCMRTTGIGLYLSVFGVGSFLSSGLIRAVETVTDGGWFSEDVGGARLDKFYLILSILSALSLVLFVLVSWRTRPHP